MNFDFSVSSFIQLVGFGVFEATGVDAGRFLHRMSTSHVEELTIGAHCLATFLNEKGRLMGLCYVKKQSENSFQLFVPYENSENLMAWLDDYLFSEDVSLADRTSQTCAIWTIGKSMNDANRITGPVFHFKNKGIESAFYLGNRDKIAALHSCFLEAGFKELAPAEFEVMRIAGRVPYSKNEINSQHNPIQLGLGDAIHWSKGCYIGQEVISRLESKDRARCLLFGVEVASSDFTKLQKSEPVLSHGQPCGTLTSIAPKYLAAVAQALVVLKKPVHENHLEGKISQVSLDIKAQGE